MELITALTKCLTFKVTNTNCSFREQAHKKKVV